MSKVQVLDHGYVEFIEDWGHGKVGEPEAGIIEAARQSTQGSFRSWKSYVLCEGCDNWWVDRVPIPDCPSCHSKLKEYPRGDMGLLSFLYSGKPQHATPFEFCGMVLEVQAPTCVVWEWVRHRTHGIEDGDHPWDRTFNVMSSRYGIIPDLDYIPSVDRLMLSGGKNKQAGSATGARELTVDEARYWLLLLEDEYKRQQELYEHGLRVGVPKEIARLALTFGRYWRLRVTANLRNWLAFMTLRADPAAQWEIQQFAREVGNVIAQRFPHTWSLFVEKHDA